MPGKIVIFGAGNIGRSFIAQVFSRAGHEIVFVDVSSRLVDALNREKRYRVMVKRNDQPDETLWVENVRAVSATDAASVASELATASMAATAVGKNNLGGVFPLLAAGLVKRRADRGESPLDIIIAENARDLASVFRATLSRLLPVDYHLEKMAGLVETSIGKMVPLMKDSDREQDPLWIFAEEYNELIVDARGFLNPIPAVADLCPRDPIAAYVDRKLFIHNMGHSATAYLGFRHHRELTCLHEVLAIPEIHTKVRRCMMEAAQALGKEYPATFTMEDLEVHADDLLRRFQNRSLGDTIYRVGRDIPRKIDKNDRLVGAMLLARKHGVPCEGIAEAVFAAALFAAHDDKGRLDDRDNDFLVKLIVKSLPSILMETCGLSHADPREADIISEVMRASLKTGA